MSHSSMFYCFCLADAVSGTNGTDAGGNPGRNGNPDGPTEGGNVSFCLAHVHNPIIQRPKKAISMKHCITFQFDDNEVCC